MSKLSHKATEYGRGHPKGDHCGVCQFWRSPHCLKVVDPMTFGALGWCDKFQRRPVHQSKVTKAVR